ncbi:hypothetical protein OG292_19765 [Streptomyces sp. NBC_01511]|uniref:hypothetical protein n=1 Tax=Streptomyces sp. NBC_01511 TaxID=2903889 RepID=UPI00386FD8A5
MAADPHPIVDAPATVAACQADRDAAQGQGAANNQLAEARQAAAEQAATRC